MSIVCLNCGKEVLGEWRRDRYSIKKHPLRFCSAECTTKYNVQHRKKGIVSRKVCPNCNKEIGATAFNRHYKACISGKLQKYSGQPKDEKGKTQAWYESMARRKGRPIKKTKINFTCQYCKVYFENKNKEAKAIHELHCRLNPNRKPYSMEGSKLTKESKTKISRAIKEKILKGEMQIPYVANHSSKKSYPEEYFTEVFKDLPVQYNYQVGLYRLDFALPDKKLYVEIDGEQHYYDKRIIAHDKERTENLAQLGWKLISRVRWASYQKLDESTRRAVCRELIKAFQN